MVSKWALEKLFGLMLMAQMFSSSQKVVAATDVKFDQDQLSICLCDGSEIHLSLSKFKWLNWLANASLDQKENWSLEPGGFAIYWPDLDDGIEVEHLLFLKS